MSIRTPIRNDADIRSVAATVLIADEYRIRPDWIHKESPKTAAYEHSGSVLAVATNSDYKHPSPRISLIDTTTGVVRQSISGSDNWALELKSRFEDVHFLDEGRVILASTRWGRLYRWDLTKSPAESKFVNVGSTSVSVFVTPDEKYCVTCNYEAKQLRCWDTRTLTQISTCKDVAVVRDFICIESNESLLFHTKKDVHLLSLPELKEKPLPRRQMSRFHPSGEFFVASDERGLFAKRSSDGLIMHRFESPDVESVLRSEVAVSKEFVKKSRFSQSGHYFAAICGTDRGSELRVWDAWGGKPRWRIPAPAGSALKWDSFAISNDGAHSAFVTEEDLVQYSRIRPALAFYRVPGHQNGVRYVRTSTDGKEISVLGERLKNGIDSIVSWKTGRKPDALHSHAVNELSAIPPQARDCLSYSPDGQWLATVGSKRQKEDKEDSGIHIVDRHGQKSSRQISLKNEGRSMGRPAFDAGTIAGFGWTSRGQLIAAIDFELLVWNLQTNPPTLLARDIPNPLNRLAGEVRSYASVAMNGTDDGWAVTIQSELRKFHVGDERIEIANRYKIPGDGNSRICRISPSNERLAIGKADGSVVLYDTTTSDFGALISDVHADSVQAMVWLSERRLITGSREGTFAVWDVSDAGALSLWYKLRLNSPVSDIAPTADKQAVYLACSDETSLRVLDLAVIDREIVELFTNSPPATAATPFPTAPATLPYDEPKSPPSGFGRGVNLGNRSDPQQARVAGEREAAEMVLAVGGSLALKDLQGNPLPIDGGVLPDRPFLVDACFFNTTNYKFNNAHLAKIVLCENLSTLSFVNATQLTDEAFASLKGVRVRNVIIDNCPLLSDKALATVSMFYAVEAITAQRLALSDDGLTAFSNLAGLRDLNVSATRITDNGLRRLAIDCPKLTKLSIEGSLDGLQSANGIAGFHELQRVDMHGGQFTDEAVSILNSIPTFKSLFLFPPINDSTIKRLEKLNSLEVLGMHSHVHESAVQLSKSIYSNVAWPQSLVHIGLVGAKISPRDEDFDAFVKLPHLKMFGVSYEVNQRKHLNFTHAGFVRFREHRPDVVLEIGGRSYEVGKLLPSHDPLDPPANPQ